MTYLTLGPPNALCFLQGTYIYKKPKVGLEAAKVIRSTATVRDSASPAGNGYMLIVDKATVGDGRSHNFQFQMVLHQDLDIDTARSDSRLVALTDGSGLFLDVHVRSPVGEPSYSIVSVPGPAEKPPAKVLVIESQNASECEFWVAVHPHLNESPSELNLDLQDGTLLIRSDASNIENAFSIDEGGTVNRKIC